MNSHDLGGDRFLSAGTRVRYDGLDEGGPEYGIVVHCWLDSEMGVYDCYVAFWGNALPEGPPTEKPYILRYAAMSLVVISDPC